MGGKARYDNEKTIRVRKRKGVGDNKNIYDSSFLFKTNRFLFAQEGASF
jgi:hypothetical protein